MCLIDTYFLLLSLSLSSLRIIVLPRSRNFLIDNTFADGDSVFKCLEGTVTGLQIVGAQSHVAEIEVEIKVVKERCRSMDASLSVPIPLAGIWCNNCPQINLRGMKMLPLLYSAL